MKYAIIALAFVSSTAFARSQESYLAEICSLKSEQAVRVAKLAKQGIRGQNLKRLLLMMEQRKMLTLPIFVLPITNTVCWMTSRFAR